MKRELDHFLHVRLINPLVARRAGSRGNRFALLETVGRKSGQPRLTPVGYGLEGNVLWIVSEHGRMSGYIQNLEANPRVRIRFDGGWRDGTARVVPDDDPLLRLTSYDPRTANEVRRIGTSLLTVRVDLEPVPGMRAHGNG